MNGKNMKQSARVGRPAGKRLKSRIVICLICAIIALPTVKGAAAGPAENREVPSGAPFLSLGPYLQFVGRDKAVLHWRTNDPAPSIVEIGMGEPPFRRLVDETPRTVHVVPIDGLAPRASYRYRLVFRSGTVETPSEFYALDTTYNCAPPGFPDGPSPYERDDLTDTYESAARFIIKETGITRGYCLVVGFGDGRLAYELAKLSDLQIIGVERDATKIERAQRRLRRAGLYGSRITVHECSATSLPYASRFVNLIVSDSLIAKGEFDASAAELSRVLRPCGGTLLVGRPGGGAKSTTAASLRSQLNEAFPEVAISNNANGIWARYTRGKPEGVGEWTHQYADAANTACSNDPIGNEPMTIQWFGRPGAGAMIDRGGRTPAPLSANGRLYVLGYDRLFGQDAYNGTILWSLEVPGLRRANVPRDSSSLAADDDCLYVAARDKCWVVDGSSGELLRVLDANPTPKRSLGWGYLACVGGTIFGSAVKPGSAYTGIDNGEWYDGWKEEGYKVTSVDLFAVDPATGDRRWTYTNGAIVDPTIAIGDGRVFFVECRHPAVLAQPTGRIGIPELWKEQHLVALNAKTGEKVWDQPVAFDNFDAVFYMSYTRNTLVVAGSRSSDKQYYVHAFDASGGQPIWDQHYGWAGTNHGKHIQHPAIVGDMIYLEPCVLNLYTGSILRNDLPVRNKCGVLSASARAIFYRDYNNGVWNLESDKRTEWQGIRAGCWLSLLPAGGLLLAPEASSGCSCPWPIQTSHAYAPR